MQMTICESNPMIYSPRENFQAWLKQLIVDWLLSVVVLALTMAFAYWVRTSPVLSPFWLWFDQTFGWLFDHGDCRMCL